MTPWLGWLGWILLGVVLLMYVSFLRYMANKANALGEYVQFLLSQPAVYADHRQKWIEFLKQQTERNPVRLSMKCYAALDAIAKRLHGEVNLANTIFRLAPEKSETK